MLQSISMNSAVKFAVKKYLHGHVKTRFIQVDIENWPIASQLPMARFKKESEDHVWKEFNQLKG